MAEAKIIIDNNTFVLQFDHYKRNWTDYLKEIGGYFLDSQWTIPIGKLDDVRSKISSMGISIEEIILKTDIPDIDITRLDTEWPGDKLRDYQKMGAYLLATHKAFGMFDDCGLGKTIETIAASWLLRKGRTLVVAEKKALDQWRDEIKRFIGEDAIIIHGNKRDWKKASDYKYVITNYHSIIRDYNDVKELKIDIAVFDEGSRYMRNRNTKMAKMGRNLSADYKWVLTGSPIENYLSDLYSIYEIMDYNILGAWENYKRNHIIYKQIRVGKWTRVDKIVGYKRTDIVQDKIAPYYIRRTAEEVGKELPEIVYQTMKIELSPLQKHYYDIINDEIKEESKRTNKSIKSFGSLIKLRRICDSSALAEDGIEDQSSKLDEIASMIAENSHRKILLFSQWTDPLELLIKRIDCEYTMGIGGVKDHNSEIERFNNDVNLMIASDAMSRSVNLQKASMVINMDLPWNPQTIHQRIHRARRIGSLHSTVFVYDFVCQDTIEEAMLPILKKKIMLGEKLIDENKFNENDIERQLENMYRRNES